jgi:tetratricopeptide (TPR) repeat protein
MATARQGTASTASPPVADEPATDNNLGSHAGDLSARHWFAWLTLLTPLAVPILFMFFLGFLYRLLLPEADFWAFSGNVAQLVALLTLIGLQLDLKRISNVHESSHLRAALWIATVAAALLFFAGPRPVAYYCNVWGAAALDDGNVSSALRSFRRAAGLDPTNAKAHFNLGSAYELLQDDEQAISEYELALTLDDTLSAAYDAIGHLYLNTGRDPDRALTLLLAGLSRVADRRQNPPKAETGEVLQEAKLKLHIGWAYLEKGLPQTALEFLQAADNQFQALSDSRENVAIYRSETHQVSALAHEALAQTEQSRIDWADCQSYALAVQESSVCAKPESHSGPDCLKAQALTDEARERLVAMSRGNQ